MDIKNSKPTPKRQNTEVTSDIKVTRKISAVKLNLNMKKTYNFIYHFLRILLPFFHKNLTVCLLWHTPPSNVAKYTKQSRKPHFGRKMLIFAIFCPIFDPKWSKNGPYVFPMEYLTQKCCKNCKKVKKNLFCWKMLIFVNF